MSYKYEGGIPIGVGYSLQSNRPLDEREIVETKNDLKSIDNCYPGIIVKVADENYDIYQWNGVLQIDLNNWEIIMPSQGIDGPAGPQGPQGADGTQGIDGADGPQGIQGPQGLKGDDGLQGIQGIEGPTGPQGLKGDDGDDGPQGPQGVQGNVGPKGDVGSDGPQGIEGDDGATGPQGPQGIQGIQGIDGSKGDTGDTGAGVQITGTDTYLNIIAKNGLVGDLWISSTDDGGSGTLIGDGMVSDGLGSGVSHWTNVGQIRGPQGIQGIQGIQGVEGIQGDEGPTGPQGIQGIQGDDGAIGPQGVQGIDGVQGPKGDTGDTGVDGPQGPQGVQGIDGATGAGLAAGGTAGQVLEKIDGTDYNTQWVDQTDGSKVAVDAIETPGYLEDVLIAGDNTTLVKSGSTLVINSEGSNEYQELEFLAQPAPLAVLADSYKMFARTSGVTPNKIVEMCVINEAFEEIILSSIKL